MRPKGVACLGIATAVGLCGCVTFRRGELPHTAWPVAAAPAKHSVSVVVAPDSMTTNGVPVDVPIAWVSSAGERIRKTYADSGLFTALLDEDELADLRSEVHLSQISEFSKPLFALCSFTGALVPVRGVDRYTMRTELKNAEGDVLLSIERSETVVTWVQAFLVFAVPFQPNMPFFHYDVNGALASKMGFSTEAKRLMRDLSRATLDEAHAKGVL
ncbi:MAG TPA: hypothetical protein VMW19_12120 [Myxococcota bacterium]|nr:hypothetical protein [Myxococcota bacterium]